MMMVVTQRTPLAQNAATSNELVPAAHIVGNAKMLLEWRKSDYL